jgi:hypothetical protein
LREREQDGLEVDWDVLRQMHDQMDAILQALQHRHRYDSSEIVDLRKDRDHWKQARQDAHEAGELMKAEVETLRQQLGNAQRELSEQGLAHSVEGWQEAADLRKQLNAAQAALTRERLDAEERARELERLRREDNARWERVVEARGQELYDYDKDLSAIWLEILQVDIAFPEEASLVQSLQILRESHVAARAEIETLRQQLADAQREAVNLQKLHDHLRPRLDAAQGQLTRERLDAEERGREIETLRQERDLAQAALTRERLDAEERNELNSRQQKGGE